MIDLYIEFNNMDRMPLFEIEYNGEYYIYNIIATDEGLEAGGCGGAGFIPYGISVEWDDCFSVDDCPSLDEHLEGLYELCYEDAVEQYNEEQGV